MKSSPSKAPESDLIPFARRKKLSLSIYIYMYIRTLYIHYIYTMYTLYIYIYIYIYTRLNKPVCCPFLEPYVHIFSVKLQDLMVNLRCMLRSGN